MSVLIIMNKNSLQAKFEKMLNHYAIAVHLSYELLDSSLLERKIKLGNDIEKINNLVSHLILSLASDIRQADKVRGVITSVQGYPGYERSALDIAEVYFYELETRGFLLSASSTLYFALVSTAFDNLSRIVT